MKTALTLALALAGTSAIAADDWRDEAARLFMNENPSSVVEAQFTARSSFWISMRDNGSSRDGFADYACLELHNFGMPKGEFVMIRVWDAYAMASGDLKEIGRSECQFKA